MMEQYALFKGLKTLLVNPQRSFSVRGLARESGLSVGSAMNCFNYFKENDLVEIRTIGRVFQFKANLDNPLAREWKRLFALEELQKIRSELLSRLGFGVISVVLYGSLALGLSDDKSDVDILVVTSKKKRFGLSDLESKIKREINLLVCTPSEWREKAKKNKVFYEQVILNSIELFGDKPVVL